MGIMSSAHFSGEKPLLIGTVPVSTRAFLAPLSGVTDLAMRRIAMRCGAGLVVSEMVASEEFVQGHEEMRLRAEGEGVFPHVVQLAACEPHWLGEAARLAEASGANIIDINMGCPAKRVTGGWAGSALMRDLDHAVSLVEAAVAAVNVPVTVKMRLGWDEATLNAPELARRAVEAGAAMITVHGRTRQQFYKGSANWAAIRAVRDVGTFPLVANGDVSTLEQARACLDSSRADAAMIGRAAVGRPWLVGQIAAGLDGAIGVEPSLAEKLAMACEHFDGLVSLMGRETGVRHARKHLAAYADEAIRSGCAADPDSRLAMLTTDDPAKVIAGLRQLFNTDRLRAAA